MSEDPEKPKFKQENFPTAAPTSPRVIDSTDLLAGEKTVLIHHQGEFYRLACTRNGKLILQK